MLWFDLAIYRKNKIPAKEMDVRKVFNDELKRLENGNSQQHKQENGFFKLFE